MIEKIKTKHGFSYRARITWTDGKDLQQTFGRKADAEMWKRIRLQERDRIRITGVEVQDSVLFSEFVAKWLNDKVDSRLSPSTHSCV